MWRTTLYLFLFDFLLFDFLPIFDSIFGLFLLAFDFNFGCKNYSTVAVFFSIFFLIYAIWLLPFRFAFYFYSLRYCNIIVIR